MARKARCMLLSCLPSLLLALDCPGKLGIAINTGDKTMDRVMFILGDKGWAGRLEADSQRRRATDSEDSKTSFSAKNVAVYSATKEDSAALGAEKVAVKPCCGGRDYSQTIGEAQEMREHTFAMMLRDFPNNTEWFLSTEEDVWWDIPGLCRVIEETVLNALDTKSKASGKMPPMILGGGDPDGGHSHNHQSIFGPFIVMNRPMLELFANETLMDDCRRELLMPGVNPMLQEVYGGARYNNDHLVSYCAFTFFPRITQSKIYKSIERAIWKPDHFIHNGRYWHQSTRAVCYVDYLADADPIGFHHASLDDMLFLQDRKDNKLSGASTITDDDRKKSNHCDPALMKALYTNYTKWATLEEALTAEQNAARQAKLMHHQHHESNEEVL